ncbi:4a-hydroxytetrahydrobiopterin dehydratase [Candidatus Berkelbacteria bacterium]|nr:4a-hydroxytetrahydrobiopterin dehydratase [Candidatus Berkelbacteria bacterium]
MDKLSQQHCVPCRGGEPTLQEPEISNLKSQVPNWEVVDDGGIKKLRRAFQFKNFAQALEFVNKVGKIAEREGHHPEIEFGWGHATITWWTHKIKGLHRNDFIMAAKTDGVYHEGE